MAEVESDSWRQKYFDSLKQVDSDEKRWAALEELLRRIVGRLCIAAKGLDENLDDVIGRVSQAMRVQVGLEELQTLLPALSEAIAALDEKTPAAAAPVAAVATALPANVAAIASPSMAPAAAAASPRIDALLARLLDQLSLFPELSVRVSALRISMQDESSSIDMVADRLHEAADLVQELLGRLRSEKGDIESMVQQFTTQLDAIAGYLRGDAADRDSAQVETQQLNARVLDEVTHLNTQVQRAADLDELRTEVRTKLTAINSHMLEFRNREKARTDAWRGRTEDMHLRIAKLEHETSLLQLSLRKEQHLAMTDALTGIANRHAYQQRIVHDFQRWNAQRQPMTLVAWDIDKFKRINDSYGHRAGDKVLQLVAQHFARNLRATDFVARYGGEEFVMIFDGAPLPQAMVMVDELRQSVASLGFHFRGEPVSITISCGLTGFADGDTPDVVFERADRLLYEAKNGGRNRCVAR